jgi:hypothetical protein
VVYGISYMGPGGKQYLILIEHDEII